jgi:hypothetical protein
MQRDARRRFLDPTQSAAQVADGMNNRIGSVEDASAILQDQEAPSLAPPPTQPMPTQPMPTQPMPAQPIPAQPQSGLSDGQVIVLGGRRVRLREVQPDRVEDARSRLAEWQQGRQQPLPADGLPMLGQPGNPASDVRVVNPDITPRYVGGGLYALQPPKPMTGTGAGTNDTYMEGIGIVRSEPGMRGIVMKADEGSGYRVGDTIGAPQGAKAEKGHITVIDPETGAPKMAAVEGSPAWEKAQKMAVTVQTMGGTVVKDARRALDTVEKNGNWAAGWGGLMKGLPATSAKELAGHLDSVKSNIGFDQLMNIKSSGAGLGHVPQTQLQTLQSVLGNLEITQRPEVLKENLRRVESVYWWIANPEDFVAHADATDFYHAGLSPEVAEELLKSKTNKGTSTGLGLSFARTKAKADSGKFDPTKKPTK